MFLPCGSAMLRVADSHQVVKEQKLRFRSFSVRRFAGNARELGSRAPGRSADVPTVRLGHASRGRLASGRLHV